MNFICRRNINIIMGNFKDNRQTRILTYRITLFLIFTMAVSLLRYDDFLIILNISNNSENEKNNPRFWISFLIGILVSSVKMNRLVSPTIDKANDSFDRQFEICELFFVDSSNIIFESIDGFPRTAFSTKERPSIFLYMLKKDQRIVDDACILKLIKLQ